ncbi:MAG: hypothetical protein JJU11_13910 [Candidatus Sumerlaeia bacterium]|nr:hypothetical protein [Candidatus Sumerlaeia bacterium]
MIPRLSMIPAMGLCLANWIVPGLGYLLVRDFARGLALLVLINGCFAMGLFYSGYVLVPVFSYRDPEFNIVSLLTYISQAFHGGGWALLQGLHSLSGENGEGLFNLHRMASRPYSDLGVFHLVVAGGLNYFATVRLYDLLAGNPELSGSSAPDGDGEAEKNENNSPQGGDEK